MLLLSQLACSLLQKMFDKKRESFETKNEPACGRQGECVLADKREHMQIYMM
jgi:hypothetical protein